MEALRTDGTSIELHESSTRRGRQRGGNELRGKILLLKWNAARDAACEVVRRSQPAMAAVA